MDLLAINTYAGSILLAAREVGLDIRGSYEDAGYGADIVRANFQGIKQKDRAPWPEDNLSDTIVLGHPPCAAFSQQNNSASAKGTDAKKFQCTVAVLEYALKNRCAALAIESVVPALEGARSLHDEVAKKHGYTVFRVLQNSVTFGLPQWRPRFWVLLIPEGRVQELMVFHKPVYRSIGQVMTECDGGAIDPVLQRDYLRQEKLLENLGLSASEIAQVLNPDDRFGSLPGILKKLGAEQNSILGNMDTGAIAKTHCVGGNFMSHCLRVLDPAGFATTLLFDSWWMCLGRVLSYDEYKAVMGFPRSYIFPGKTQAKFREFLSRGVCPPVARWIIETLIHNLANSGYGSAEDAHRLKPGETLDLSPKKSEVRFE